MTKIAQLILQVIENSDKHFTAEEIFFEIKQVSKKTVLASVYNNLKLLESQGMIIKLSMKDGPDRYDKKIKHDHLICCKCGKISDISFNDLTEMIKKKIGSDFISYDLRVNYVCPNCKKQKRAD